MALYIEIGYAVDIHTGQPLERPYQVVDQFSHVHMFSTATDALAKIREYEQRGFTLRPTQAQQDLYGYFQGMAAEEA